MTSYHNCVVILKDASPLHLKLEQYNVKNVVRSHECKLLPLQLCTTWWFLFVFVVSKQYSIFFTGLS